MKRPAGQTDPDAYLHLVEKKSDGIVVRGCKVHISLGAIADEILVVPTRALTREEVDYAVGFAVPGDHEGVKQVIHPHNMRKRKHFQRDFSWGLSDSYVIFDDVFVPWDRGLPMRRVPARRHLCPSVSIVSSSQLLRLQACRRRHIAGVGRVGGRGEWH